MMRFRVVLLLGMIGTLAGCAVSQNPVGFEVEPKLRKELSEDFTATWYNPKGELDLSLDQEGKVIIRFEELDKKTNEMKQEEYEGVLLSANDEFFVINLMNDEEDKSKQGYVFLLTSLDDDEQFVLWTPNLDTLDELVNEGKLQGKVGKYDVRLTGDGEEIAKVLLEKGLENSFTWNKPAVFWRKESE